MIMIITITIKPTLISSIHTFLAAWPSSVTFYLITIIITPVVCEFTKSYVWFSKLNKIDETQVTETFII